MNEFKLNYYFNEYKDFPLPSREKFRSKFKKEHGKFQYLEELILMIERYQMKKFGTTLNNFYKFPNKEELEKLKIRSNGRKYYKRK